MPSWHRRLQGESHLEQNYLCYGICLCYLCYITWRDTPKKHVLHGFHDCHIRMPQPGTRI